MKFGHPVQNDDGSCSVQDKGIADPNKVACGRRNSSKNNITYLKISTRFRMIIRVAVPKMKEMGASLPRLEQNSTLPFYFQQKLLVRHWRICLTGGFTKGCFEGRLYFSSSTDISWDFRHRSTHTQTHNGVPKHPRSRGSKGLRLSCGPSIGVYTWWPEASPFLRKL